MANPFKATAGETVPDAKKSTNPFKTTAAAAPVAASETTSQLPPYRGLGFGSEVSGTAGDVLRGAVSAIPGGNLFGQQPEPLTKEGRMTRAGVSGGLIGLGTGGAMAAAGASPAVLSGLNRSTLGRAVTPLLMQTAKTPGISTAAGAAAGLIQGTLHGRIDEMEPVIYGHVGDIPVVDLRDIYRLGVDVGPAGIIPGLKAADLLVRKTPVVGGVYRWGERQVTSMAPGQQRKAAYEDMEEVLRNAKVDMLELQAALRDESGVGLTTAEQSQVPDLLSMQKALEQGKTTTRRRPAGYARDLYQRRLARAKEAKTRMAVGFGEAGNEAALTLDVQQRMGRLYSTMEADVSQAAERYANGLTGIRAVEDLPGLQQAFKGEIESKRTIWHGLQAAKWKALERNVPAESKDASRLVDMLDVYRADPDFQGAIPADVARAVRAIETKLENEVPVTVMDLHAVRRAALEHLRKPFNVDVTHNSDYVAKIVQDEALKGMYAAMPAEKDLLDEARDMTRMYYDTFYRGAVGKLYRGKFNDPKVKDVLSIKAILGRGQQEAAADLDQILAVAVTETPEGKLIPDATSQRRLMGYMTAYLENRAYSQFFLENDRPNPEQILRWVKGSGDSQAGILLQRFPVLRDKLINIATHRRDLTKAEGVLKDAKDLHAKSIAAKVLQNDPRHLADIFWTSHAIKHPDGREMAPDTYLEELIKETRKDLSGEALKGLRTSFKEALFSHIRENETLDEQNLVNMQRLINEVLEPSKLRGLQKLLDPEEVTRLQRYLTALQKQYSAKPGQGYIPEPKTGAVVTLTRWLALQALGMFKKGNRSNAGVSLQEANFLSQFAEKVSRRFTTDHYLDFQMDLINEPKLFAEYMALSKAGQLDTELAGNQFEVIWPKGAAAEFGPRWQYSQKTGREEWTPGPLPKVRALQDTPLAIWFATLLNKEILNMPSMASDILQAPPPPQE